jgi:hypothetical protein
MATVIKADFHWNFDPLTAKGLEPGGRVQQAIDTAVIRYSMPYVPFETGTLATSPYRASPPGSGQVIYETPYARYLYYGQVMGPNIPVFEDDSGVPTRYFSPPGRKKHLTGKALKYNQDTNPEAGAFWFARMKAVHAQDIVEEANRVANSK